MAVFPAWFRVLRKMIRFFCPPMKIRNEEETKAPCVYITRHLNNYGPPSLFIYVPFEFHLWVYHVFVEKESCYRQFSEYTFSKRCGMGKGLSSFLAACLSGLVSSFLHAIKAIPVYRGMKSVMKTMELSTEVLEKGENLLLMADRDYTAEGGNVGNLYSGFIFLGKTYYKKTGKRLCFSTISLNREEHYLRFGKRIEFNPEAPYQAERDRILSQIRQELQDDH